jgi:hypothetical protein
LYVKDNINVSRRDDLDFDDLEGIWVQIKINGKQILFEIFYIPSKKYPRYMGEIGILNRNMRSMRKTSH